MKIDYMKCMKIFHKAFNVPIAKQPTLIDGKNFMRRLDLSWIEDENSSS